MLAGIGLDFGSVDGHVAQLHQARFRTQQQPLGEQTRKAIQMTLAELGQGGVVRVLVARQVAESYVLVGAPLNFARAVHPGRIAIQKQADHHLRSVGRLTSPILLLVRLVDRAQVQRRYHIHQKTRQVARGKPIMQRGGKQKRLIHRIREKVLAHESKVVQIPPSVL